MLSERLLLVDAIFAGFALPRGDVRGGQGRGLSRFWLNSRLGDRAVGIRAVFPLLSADLSASRRVGTPGRREFGPVGQGRIGLLPLRDLRLVRRVELGGHFRLGGLLLQGVALAGTGRVGLDRFVEVLADLGLIDLLPMVVGQGDRLVRVDNASGRLDLALGQNRQVSVVQVDGQ